METLKKDHEDTQEQLIQMYDRITEMENEHNKALESHAANSDEKEAELKKKSTKDKKDLLRLMSSKFVAEKKALILEMEAK